jgi:hypothetical protein
MRLLVEQPDGVTFTWLVKGCARKGIGKQTVWRHLDRFVADGLAVYSSMRRLYYPSGRVLGVHGYGGPFKVDVESDDVGKGGQVNVNPIMSGGGLFSLLAQRFQIVFQGYLNLLGMVREVGSWSAANTLSIFLLDEMNDELLRLAHEVWSQKKPVPLKELDGKQVGFRVRYSDARKHPHIHQTA